MRELYLSDAHEQLANGLLAPSLPLLEARVWTAGSDWPFGTGKDGKFCNGHAAEPICSPVDVVVHMRVWGCVDL